MSPILSFLGLLFLFYPVIPTLALIALLWVRPREDSKASRISSRLNRISRAINGNIIKEPLRLTVSEENKKNKYRQMDFFVTIAHAIAGGVESPLQLSFQVSITSGSSGCS